MEGFSFGDSDTISQTFIPNRKSESNFGTPSSVSPFVFITESTVQSEKVRPVTGSIPPSEVIGGVLEKLIEVHFEWTIPDFFSLTADTKKRYNSPRFSVRNFSWYLRLYPYGCNAKGWLSLYLHKENSYSSDEAMTITITLGIKKSNGKLEEVASFNGIFEESQLVHGEQHFWNRDDLLRRKSELVPSDTLTLMCRMTEGVPQDLKVAQQNIKLKDLEILSTNFRDLFTSKTKYDVTLKVKKCTFQAHKAVLIARSRVFASMFEHDLSEEETGAVTIADSDPDSFGDFLHYLYTGTIDDVSFRNAYHLYITADKYDVKELGSFCVAYIIRNLTVRNVCDVVTMAKRYGETGLMSSAQMFFNRNVSGILSTDEWETLLKENHLIANKLLKEMASNIKIQD